MSEMLMRRLPTATFVATMLMVAVVACTDRGTDVLNCPLGTVAGVIVFLPDLRLEVRDVLQRGQALGDSVIVRRGPDSVVAVGSDSLVIQAGFGTSGSSDVRVKRRYYNDAVVSNVVVTGGACGALVPVTVPITLTLVPGAPSLRSVAILGERFVAGPGQQSALSARVDADPGVPTTVTWHLSDTTAVRIDPNGTLTGKCVTAARIDTVTARSTVDTTVRGIALVSVATQPRC
jgi:hypothetical protein